MIAAHYGFSDVFDNLIISLCKFTTLSSEVRLDHKHCAYSANRSSLPLFL